MEIAAHFEHRADGNSADDDVLTPRQPRRMLRLEAAGETVSGVTAVTVHNISRSGMLLETTVPLSEGETIDLELPHVGKVRARVVWASDRFHGCAFDAPISPGALSAAQLRGESPAGQVAEDEPAPLPGNDAADVISLGARIQRLRKARGMTLSDLAALMGVSKPTVWAWEQGKARPIDTRFAALAEVLRVSVAELQPAGGDPGAQDVIARARRQIAAAYRTNETSVRIMIEL